MHLQLVKVAFWLGKVFLQLLLSVGRLCAVTLMAEEETRKLYRSDAVYPEQGHALVDILR